MLGKANWFQKRKYGGWGITPKTWQGWVYILTFIAILLIFHSMPFWNDFQRFVFTGVWLLILSIDVIQIMINLKKDELEKIQEAVAERNASWTMAFVLTIGILYQLISSGLQQKIELDPFLALALAGGLIAKSLSYWKLEKK
jgi:high-affinity Fe2+/Pb2+ permease